MTNYKEILRLHSLGINNTRIAESCACARSTVIATLQRAAERELSWSKVKNVKLRTVVPKKLPTSCTRPHYRESSTKCRTMSGCTVKCRRAASL